MNQMMESMPLEFKEFMGMNKEQKSAKVDM